MNYTANELSVVGQPTNLKTDEYDFKNGNNQLLKTLALDDHFKTESEFEEDKVEEVPDIYWKEYTIVFNWEQFVRGLKSLYHIYPSGLGKLKLLIPGSNRNIYTRFIKTVLK